ncbi:tRNA pseudouridine synthase-like 1 [Epargyreus clarus]|uniref:tRNA pseudouridine synthase-like 1 n=1 Tax=Epargyreus clarus TaxID=520877 RepID=UPI003C2D6078
MKSRYFTVFSYIGTKFRSSEKLWLKGGSTLPDPDSVQGMMEIALTKQNPKDYPMVHLSSRTDGGVHALNSSAHFDLEPTGARKYYPEKIVYDLNTFFWKTNTPILVKRCIRVSDDFNARYLALSRTYLYRLAILKKDVELLENTCISQIIPIEELDRCHFLRIRNFDIEKFKEGSKEFLGYHDFTTFKKFDKLQQNKSNRRTLHCMDVRPGRSMLSSFSDNRQDSMFDYWDIEIKGRSFVHNQIRRMIGTLISVAIGKLPPEEIKVMLQVPSKHSWYSFIGACPPHGLYLCNVKYDPKDLVFEDTKNKVSLNTAECEKNSDKTVVTCVDGKKYVEGNERVCVASSAYGFVVDTKPDDVPVLIVSYLYIGSQDCAVDKVLREYNIKHVLSLGVDMNVIVNHKFVQMLDLPETNIKQVLSECLHFIQNAVEMKENVLVHCNAGVSRTSMVAIAYLMHYEHMQYEDAYSLVKAKRPAIQPNAGFSKQLKNMKPGEII